MIDNIFFKSYTIFTFTTENLTGKSVSGHSTR